QFHAEDHQREVDLGNNGIDDHAEEELQPAVEEKRQSLVEQKGDRDPSDGIGDLEAPRDPEVDERGEDDNHNHEEEAPLGGDGGEQSPVAQAIEGAIAS